MFVCIPTPIDVSYTNMDPLRELKCCYFGVIFFHLSTFLYIICTLYIPKLKMLLPRLGYSFMLFVLLVLGFRGKQAKLLVKQLSVRFVEGTQDGSNYFRQGIGLATSF